jgi:uncharacterized membrane protein (UPF0127 family)
MSRLILVMVNVFLFVVGTFAVEYTNVYIVNEGKTNLIFAELAVTEEEKERGLMFRKNLETNKGMLFIFDKPSYVNFWMKNTYLPLAIIFIDENYMVSDVFYPKPLSTGLVSSSKRTLYVLEILKNTSLNLNIKRGAKIILGNINK